MAQYRAKRSGREIAPMNGHDCLAAGIIPLPQEMMRPLGSDHLKAGPLQGRDDVAARERRQRSDASALATGTS